MMIRTTKTVFCILALSSSTLTVAQTTLSLSAGLAASWQSTKLSGQRYATHSLFAPSANVAIDIPICSQWSIQPALGFIQKGGDFPLDYTGPGSGGQTLRINELELAVRARYRKTGKRLDTYLALGPYAGFLLSKKITNNGQTTDDNSPYRAAEFGLSLAPGVEMHIKSALLFIEARYLLGITQVNDDSDSPVLVKNRLHSAGLSAGFRFSVGGNKK